MAEVIVLPGLPRGGGSGSDRIPVDETSTVRTLRAKYPASSYALANVVGMIFA